MDGPDRLFYLDEIGLQKGVRFYWQFWFRLLRGIGAQLIDVGRVQTEPQIRTLMTIYPFLDKNNPEQFEIFENILKQSHFMIMPSFESYGFAFCEASTYGLPSLCYQVSGVPLFERENGHTLPVGASPDGFVEKVEFYLALVNNVN